MPPTITSQRHFIRFYLALFSIFLFFFLMGLMVLGIFVHLYYSPQFQIRNYLLIPLFLLVCAAAIYISYQYIKTAPTITVTLDAITINRKGYNWTDLEKVELTGKRPFILFNWKEGMLLEFKGGDLIKVIDDSYSNLYQIKLFIKHYIIEKRESPMIVITPPHASELSGEQFLFYRNSQFFNYRGIALLIILAGLVYASIVQHGGGTLVAALCFGTLAFFGMSYFLFYCGISNNYLIVKNHNRFWTRKIYRLTDIKEVVFEQQDRWPNCLVIITNDFQSDFFPAATLWDNTWRALQVDLENKRVKVRNELLIG